MGHVEAGQVILEALRFLNRIEITALDVLHQRGFHGFLVIEIDYTDRDVFHPRIDSRTQAALAGDELETVATGADHHRLQHAVLLDGITQAGQFIGIEMPAGLVGIVVNHPHRHLATRALDHALGLVAVEQGIEAATHARAILAFFVVNLFHGAFSFRPDSVVITTTS